MFCRADVKLRVPTLVHAAGARILVCETRELTRVQKSMQKSMMVIDSACTLVI